jgi:hypothetical protein
MEVNRVLVSANIEQPNVDTLSACGLKTVKEELCEVFVRRKVLGRQEEWLGPK